MFRQKVYNGIQKQLSTVVVTVMKLYYNNVLIYNQYNPIQCYNSDAA